MAAHVPAGKNSNAITVETTPPTQSNLYILLYNILHTIMNALLVNVAMLHKILYQKFEFPRHMYQELKNISFHLQI